MRQEERQIFAAKLEEVFEKSTRSTLIHESTMHVEDSSGDFLWSKGYGGRTVDSVMNLASVTKLFTTTCIIKLIQQGKLSLDDRLHNFFSSEILAGIHRYKGKDYSDEITVGNLLFQNSGFPDVFAMGSNHLNKRMLREDLKLSLEDYVKIAKDNKKKFAPGTPGKAHYSDLNFEMLGRIIEQVEGSSLHDAFKKYVFEPLHLQHTYLLETDSDYCADLYYKQEALYRPNLLRSIPACGGCMSTSKEVMIFLKAFFSGQLFDKSIFSQLKKFATIQYSPGLGQYGGGFVRLNISGIASMYRCKGELLGHMGATGTYAYYYPEKDLYFVGDINQLAKPGEIFILPLKLAKLANKYIS
jgi:D-alanyl-D-alanine carboxypeptidase